MESLLLKGLASYGPLGIMLALAVIAIGWFVRWVLSENSKREHDQRELLDSYRHESSKREEVYQQFMGTVGTALQRACDEISSNTAVLSEVRKLVTSCKPRLEREREKE